MLKRKTAETCMVVREREREREREQELAKMIGGDEYVAHN